jgi:hypothetical protein
MRDGSVDLGNTALGSKRRGSFRLCWCRILIIGRLLVLMTGLVDGGLQLLDLLVDNRFGLRYRLLHSSAIGCSSDSPNNAAAHGNVF